VTFDIVVVFCVIDGVKPWEAMLGLRSISISLKTGAASEEAMTRVAKMTRGVMRIVRDDGRRDSRDGGGGGGGGGLKFKFYGCQHRNVNVW